LKIAAMRHAPQRVKATAVVEWNDGDRLRVLDELAGEEPLEIRVGQDVVTVTMRTPGDDFELAAGFLYSEGIVEGRDHIARISYGRGPDCCQSGNIVEVKLRRRGALDFSALQRRFFAASGCGICGRTSIEAMRSRKTPRADPHFSVQPELLTRLPSVLRSAQRAFGRTGGLHAAGLFDADGNLSVVHEDIGRHNAVDKVIGHALLHGGLPCTERILLVSGRGGFEIVQKALAAGLPILASASAPSSLAVQLARDGGLTLIGFLRDRRFVVYSHPDRIAMSRDARRALSPAM
jgi:FdhD protein